MNVILTERVILCQQIAVQSPVLMNFIDRIRIRAISRQRDSLNDLNHSGGFCLLKICCFHVVLLVVVSLLRYTGAEGR